MSEGWTWQTWHSFSPGQGSRMLGFGLLTAETVRSLGSASELCTPTGETYCARELTELLVVRKSVGATEV